MTQHFDISEFACNDGTAVPSKYKKNVIKLAAALEVIRYACGNLPITIDSGYRTKEYNKSVGGASKSLHLTAKAVDITHPTLTPKQIHHKISNLIEMGAIPQGGLGLYDTFVHYDIRGTIARWDNSK